MEDLIRRSDAIKALHDEWDECLVVDECGEYIADICENVIDIIPSADTDISEYSDKLWKNAYERGKADRPQGEWLIFDGESDLYVDIKCSYCRKVYTVDSYKRDDIGFTIEDLNYCPNCGARMKGADDE